MPANLSTIPSEVRSHRYLELDSLRGVAALTVILTHFHAIWIDQTWAQRFTRSVGHVLIAGHEAVVFFFLLSGFVLSASFGGRNPPSYPAYLAKRFCRIYLPYAASLILAFLLCRHFYADHLKVGTWVNTVWDIRPTWEVLFSTLLTSPRYVSHLNVALWSITLEMHVSLVFPLLYLAARRLPVAASLFLAPAVPLLAYLFHPPLYCLQLLIVSAIFLVGALLQLHIRSLTDFVRSLGRASRIFFAAGSVLLFEGTLILLPNFELGHIPTFRNYLADYPVALGASGLLLLAVASDPFRHLLHRPVLVRSGALSYSLYLTHATVLWTLIHLFYGRFPFGYILPAYLLLAWLTAEAFHFFIDQQAVWLGRKAGNATEEALRSFFGKASTQSRI